MTRVKSDTLDALLGQTFPLLNDGFIRLVDYMGDDSSIVQAARVSYGVGTKKVSQDRSLIRYLMRHHHTSPFEMCEIKFHLRVPMDCWRQWIRHRTANVNEYSTRYSIAIDSAQTTEPNQWRSQTSSNRQGSAGFIDENLGKILTEEEKMIQSKCREIYKARIDRNVAREQARKDLPLATYTEAYWKIDLHNLLHFLELRMSPNAQQEIRQYANIIGYEIVSKWVPFAWEAFLDYRLNAMLLSSTEIQVLSELLTGKIDLVLKSMQEKEWLIEKEGVWVPNREATEFEEKINKIGIIGPWQEKQKKHD